MNWKKLCYLPVILVIAFVLMGSCKKLDDSPYAHTIDGGSLFTLTQSASGVSDINADGIFFYQSNLVNNDSNLKDVLSIGGLFYDKSGNVQTNGGPVFVGNQQLGLTGPGNYGSGNVSTKDLCGKTIVFKLSPPLSNMNGTPVTLSDSLYSPEAIYITNVPAMTSPDIKVGSATPITWNGDRKNRNGVVIIAEYLPSLYANRIALSNGYSELIIKSIMLPDNGSTTIPWSFFSNFPMSAQVALWVGRGNYKMMKSGQSEYLIGGYTGSAVWYTFK